MSLEKELAAIREEMGRIYGELKKLGRPSPSVDLYTQDEAALRLAMSKKTLRRRIKSGLLLKVEDGRIPAKEVERYAAQLVEPKQRRAAKRRQAPASTSGATGAAGAAKVRAMLKGRR